MIKPTKSSHFNLPSARRVGVESDLSLSAQISRNIRSLYLMAKTVVSKVAAIEEVKPKLVLVVDDEPLTVELIDEYLQEAKLDCDILTAISGQRAYDIAISVVPDLIITDWLIPEIDGLELIKLLKSNRITKDIPVIMVTGMMAPYDEFEKVLQSGAIDYIRKPLDYTELKTRVKAALALDAYLKQIKRQKEDIHVKNQFVNFLIDDAPSAIFYQDPWGRFLGCNKHFESLVKRCHEEIIGKLPEDILSESFAAAMETHFSSLRECGSVHKFEIEIPAAEENRHIVLSYVAFGNNSIEVVMGSITDITEK